MNFICINYKRMIVAYVCIMFDFVNYFKKCFAIDVKCTFFNEHRLN